MCLINNHCIVASRRIGKLAEHERKLLQRRDDDLGLLTKECCCELVGIFINLDHHASGMFELVNRVLKLLVKYDAIGNHDHLVKHFLVVRIMQIGKPMTQPGNRV